MGLPSQTILDAVEVGVVVQEATGSIVYGNAAAERVLGLTLDQMRGRTSVDPRWRSLREDGSPFPGEEHPAMQALRDRRPVRGVMMGVQRPDGSRVWIRIDAVPVLDAGGGATQVVTTFTDVTPEIAASAALRESVELFRSLAEFAPVGIFRTDPGGGNTYANPRLSGILGLSQEAIRGAGWLSAVHPEDVGRLSAAWEGAVRAVRSFEASCRLRMADGAERHARAFAAPVWDDGGTLAGFVGVMVDETARVMAERSLVEARDRLAAFVEYEPAAVAMFDREMRYVAASRRWLEQHGLAGTSPVGRRHYELSPQVPEEWRAAHRRCLAGSVERSEEDRFPRPDGGVDWVRWEMRPWRNAGGAVDGLIIFSENITERKVAEEHAQVASRLAALGTLVAGVAHEINNPLAAELASEGFALEAVTAMRRALDAGAPVDPGWLARELAEVEDALGEAMEGGGGFRGL